MKFSLKTNIGKFIYNLALAIFILLGAHIYKTGFQSMKLAYLTYHTGGDALLKFSWGADI